MGVNIDHDAQPRSPRWLFASLLLRPTNRFPAVDAHILLYNQD
jgi:hypothetical protein